MLRVVGGCTDVETEGRTSGGRDGAADGTRRVRFSYIGRSGVITLDVQELLRRAWDLGRNFGSYAHFGMFAAAAVTKMSCLQGVFQGASQSLRMLRFKSSPWQQSGSARCKRC